MTNTATDTDLPANTLTYSLLTAPSGASISPSGVITWTPTEAQGPSVNTFTTRVVDNGSPAFSDTNSFTVTVNEVNSAPTLPTQINRTINELTTLTVTNTATDTDLPANTLTYSLLTAPSGASISPSGVITWTPTEAQGPGTNTITTRVVDNGTPALSQTNSFTVVVNEVNTPPVLTLPADASVNALVPYSAAASATDADLPANALTFALVSGPTGLSVSTSGAINWTPSVAQSPSTNIVKIRVTDSNPQAVNATALSVTNSFQIIVIEGNTPPVLATIPDTYVILGQTLSFTASATDNDQPPQTLTYTLDAGAPANAAINPATGAFSWTPTIAQVLSTNQITIRVTDDGTPPSSSPRSFTATVLNPPTVTATSLVGDTLTLSWPGVPGKMYRVQYKNDLAAGTWTTLGSDLLGAGSPLSIEVDVTATPKRFYQIVVLP